ncbi:DUF748 domain-containing protein [Paraburkholderia kururiensis]|uniref:DUF748 domain-containing protein n=1 Tax=Paraburkholderia kururiensis TaxID=984307 RepID=A0ABZ0WNJ7_9BURK|nr:DUF748 domain-containing protein [Paraburkholderia kururiensis]WQD78932.1 DUF748 domain-containing protein [Paraburkholderia kururiensis]
MASINKAFLTSSLRAVRDAAHSRRARRIGIGLVVFLVLFGLLGFFAAPPLIRHIAAQQLSQQLDRPVSIGRIALNPYTLRFEADRVHIGERGGSGDFADVERLIVKPSWTSLFRGAAIVDELQIDSPRFHIVRYDAQRFNFSDLIEKFSKPSQPSSKPTPFSISNIHLENGRVEFDDRLLGEQHVVDRWSLGVPFIATLASKTDIFVEPLLRARIDGSQLAIDGKTLPFAASRQSQVSLRLDALDVPRLISYVPAKLPVTVQSGKLSTDLKLNFLMSGDTPSLTVSGTVDLNDANVLDPNKAPFFAARAVHVAASTLEPLKSVYHFDEIRLDGADATLTRDKSGVLSVQRMFAGSPQTSAGASAAHVGSAPVAGPAPGAAASASASAGASAASASSGAASAATAASAPKSETATTAAAPLDLAIKRFALNDSILRFTDETPSKPVAFGPTKVSATLADFSTLAKTNAHYGLNLAFDGGGSLAVSGALGLVAKTADAKIDVNALPLAPRQPYLDSVTAAQMLDGTLTAHANVSANWGATPFQLQVGASDMQLKSLKVAMRGAARGSSGSSGASNEPAIALADGRVQVKKVDLAAHTADIDAVDLKGLKVNAERRKDGRIDLADLAGTHEIAHEPASSHPAAHAAGKTSQPTAPEWHYRIGTLSLADSEANFTDSTTARPVKLNVAPLQLKIQQITDNMSRPLPVELHATVNRKGTLGVTGDVTPTPLKAAVRVNADRLDVAALEPYFGNVLNVTIASAFVTANGDLAASQGNALKASYRGDAALVDVRMLDKATSDPFAGWRSLALTNLKANYDERGTDVDAARVTFSNFYGRVLLDAQGKLNLKDVVAHQTGEAQSLTRDNSGKAPVPLSPPTAAEAAAASAAAAATAKQASAARPASAPSVTVVAAKEPESPVRMHFGELLLRSGRVTYTDNFVKPNYTANLVDIQGKVGAFGTQSTTPAPVDVAAKLAANGPVAIRGSVNPLIEKPQLDLTATAHDVELTNLTPYSTKYAGYPITKGKLNVDLHYKLENNQLTANNHLFIDQLTFGDHVENDTATKLPVRLAISLLKNSKGQIDVNIPVSGSLDNPQFSFGSLIWHAVLNLLQKAVTSPFTLLANAFGGGGEELGYVEFAPGSAELTEADNQKLDKIAKALADKPSVKIDLIGRVDPAVDEPALRNLYVDRLVRQQKLKDTIGKGESVDPMSIKVDPAEYESYLAKVYKAADFKKPRNFIGLTKSLPADEMKSALAEHAPINEASLRDLAQRRAQSVQQYFDGKVDSSRVFIVAPKLNADGISDKGAATRVDFGLK